jgi:hypothetical protein
MSFKKGWDSRTPGTLEQHWSRYVSDRPVNKCWEWQGTKDKDGYGKFCHDKKHLRGHRASYIIHHGEIPDGLLVCHTCDNPSCVNPAHLFLGDTRMNTIDMIHKSRGPLQKLNPSDIVEIRKMLAEGYGVEDLAVRYSVHPYTIRRIRNGSRWGHVQGAAA